jgi:DNA polymerase/3'-5' exonuclease PolX
MDTRTAAHTLDQIAAFLTLRGENAYKARAYEQAARAVIALETDDLGALDRKGELAATRGLGPATLSVIRDLVETGESRYLEELRAETPPGLVELLSVPGLATAKIHQLHQALGVDSMESLEAVCARWTSREAQGVRTEDGGEDSSRHRDRSHDRLEVAVSSRRDRRTGTTGRRARASRHRERRSGRFGAASS